MKSEGSMSTKARRSYTEAFKEEAVRLVRESDHSVAQVARGVGRLGKPSGPSKRNWSGCGARMPS